MTQRTPIDLRDGRHDDLAGYARLIEALPPQAVEDVRIAMAEDWRWYHAPWHLGRMWNLQQRLGSRAWDGDIALAVAYHDIVYLPRSLPRENELASAALFLERAGSLGCGLESAARISRWIVASADHLGAGAEIVKRGQDPVGAWFLDMDLEPLAVDEALFDDNTALLAHEYGHLPKETFDAGRLKFLDAILAGPRIYRSEHPASVEWEGRARANLWGAIRLIEAGRSPMAIR